MKLKGIFGKGSGKLGNAVFAVSGGEQLVKEYNPRVSNPNTDAQVEQRAKFKLMSQLARDLASVITFKKEGLKSARNLFVSANIGAVTIVEGIAKVDIQSLTLTGKSTPFPNIQCNAAENNKVSLALLSSATANVSRVIYVACIPNEQDQLEVSEVKIVTEAGQNRTFPTEINKAEENIALFAYGVIDKSAEATTRYDNYAMEGDAVDAKLAFLINSSESFYDYTRTGVGLYEE